jgi:hypothetical protein
MNANAGWPPIVTVVPPSAVGALMPLKSPAAQVRIVGLVARFTP